MSEMLIDNVNIESVYGFALAGYTTPLVPLRKQLGVDIPGADGIFRTANPFSTMSIVANVVCSGNTVEEVRQKYRTFLAWLNRDREDRAIVFNDDPTVVRYAVLEQGDELRVIDSIEGAMGSVAMTFNMADPYQYTINETVQAFTVGATAGWNFEVINGAMPTPFTITVRAKQTTRETVQSGAALGNTASSGAGTLAASGISIVVNQTQTINYLDAIIGSDVLVINTKNYLVTKNGVKDLKSWSGDMPLLKNGTNAFSVSNTTGADLHVTISFRGRWI